MINALSKTGADRIAKKVYAFGSYLSDPNPNDIDLLFIYIANSSTDYAVAINFRKAISDEVRREFSLDTDIILLTENEEKNIRFVEAENACLIWSSHASRE